SERDPCLGSGRRAGSCQDRPRSRAGHAESSWGMNGTSVAVSASSGWLPPAQEGKSADQSVHSTKPFSRLRRRLLTRFGFSVVELFFRLEVTNRNIIETSTRTSGKHAHLKIRAV